MAERKADAITNTLVDVATVNVPEGGHTFNLSVNAVDAGGVFVAAGAGTAAIEFKSGVNDRWEPLLDAAAAPVVIDLTAPTTVAIEAGGIRQFRATPAALAGAGIVGIRLSVWVW